VAVTHDNSSSAGSPAGSNSILSFSHTVNAGDNRILVVAVSNVGGTKPDSVVYGGKALTEVVTGSISSTFCTLYFLVNPDVGADTVQVTILAGGADIAAGASSYFGAAQSNPFVSESSDTGTDNAPSQTVDISASDDGSLWLDALATTTALVTATVGAGQTERWNETTGDDLPVSTSSTEPRSAFVVMSWSLSGIDNWAQVWGRLVPAVPILSFPRCSAAQARLTRRCA